MAVSTQAGDDVSDGRGMGDWKWEAAGLAVLAALLAYFLHVSWLRWPDPMIDSGPQWYAAWRVSSGASLFANYQWNYGPLSAYFNGLLFRVFGVSLHVLFAANLLIYGMILALAYAAFRRAWGWLGAFAACATFISVFSFSALNAVGNYNYGSPYSHESTHGIFILFLTILVAAEWSRGPSVSLAFMLGMCGGLAAVLKPEFMLACGLLGFSALVMRFLQKQILRIEEWFLLAVGVAWPTAAFTLGFGSREPLHEAFAHAANAWWVVLVHPVGISGFKEGMEQLAGLDRPWANALIELKAGAMALLVILGIRIGWVAALGSLGLVMWVIFTHSPEADIQLLGRCFPVVVIVALLTVLFRLFQEWRQNVALEPTTVTQWMIALAAAAMLARMALLSRVDHIGFFQAALAGMVVAAFLIDAALCVKRPFPGVIGALAVLGICCGMVAKVSVSIHGDQTQPVGFTEDRFYAFDKEVDPAAALVNWAVDELRKTPPEATVQFIPDGWLTEVSEALSVNFLSRHWSPIPIVSGDAENDALERLRKAPPNYIVEFSGNYSSGKPIKYGEPGGLGGLVVPWIEENYDVKITYGGLFSGRNLKGARILQKRK